MYSIGIDSGSVATKAVLFNGEVVDYIISPTGWNPKESSKNIYKEILEKNKIYKSQIVNVIGTGYGRISMDFIDKAITEITCHAKGMHYLNTDTRTILDIGGQDSKVINIDENGNVIDFFMNDKCAAGTGRFLQVMAVTLGIDIEKIDEEIDINKKAQKISSMCTVFAESEVVSLLAQGMDKASIFLGILESIGDRASTMLHRINLNAEISFSGGVAKSNLIKKIIEKKIKKEIYVPYNSQIIGALGAAVKGYKID
ncbi:acyl-CoA dehydratase activase [Abyssisolibacter fermentans]|uniref:acyl-CoA dehydratase activase n=1 Tax=Abyssisolibacter fermentans TaxID=1766203 RepID=UPI00082FC353|nr:acyl-CoA dehydratase activase [Abyssisolibacter fermentans]